jgi:hypothetical protein
MTAPPASDDSSSATSLFVVIGALLAAAGIGGPVYFQQAKPVTGQLATAPAPEKGDRAPAVSEQVGATQLLREALGNQPNRIATVPEERALFDRQAHNASRDRLASELRNLRRDFPEVELTFLIATLPDPIDSHFPLYFDSQLAAIEWALKDYDYIPDRYNLPWQIWLRARTEKSGPPRFYREQPGVLVFRRTESHSNGGHDQRPAGATGSHEDRRPAEFLLLFLVGETPTAGVHKVALSSCLDFVDLWDAIAHPKKSTPGHKTTGREIAIVGPTFSGSSYSLSRCLKTWYDETPQSEASWSFFVCTGSANAKDNLAILRSDSKPLVSFSATIIDADTALDGVLDFLGDRIDHEKIALLFEASTGYASSVSESFSLRRHKKEQESKWSKVLELTYPMQIGRLRNEYDKARQLLPPSQPSTPTTRPKLDFSFDRTPLAVDNLPLFSGEGAVLAERQLAATLSMISRRDIRAVGIIGSDVNDVLFLSQQVRRYAPDVQLFTLGTDLLYATPEYLPYTTGMIVASAYPLFPNNHAWCGQDQKALLPFPNEMSIGVYNATRVLMNERFNDRAQKLYEFGSPFPQYFTDWKHDRKARVGQPSFWLTMVGADGLWPLRAHNLDPSSVDESALHEEAKPAPLEGTITTFPSGFNGFVVGALAIACVAFLFISNSLAVWPQAGPTPHDRTPKHWWGPFAPLPANVEIRIAQPAGPTGEVTIERTVWPRAYWFALVLFAGLLSVLWCFSASPWAISLLGFQPEARQSLVSWWIVLIVTGLGIAASVIALIWISWKFVLTALWPGPSASGRRSWGIVVMLALIAVVVLAIAAVGTVLWDRLFFWIKSENPLLDTVIVAERWGTYSSGLSPVVAASLLGGIVSLWALYHLRRLHMLSYYPLGVSLGKTTVSQTEDPSVELGAGVALRFQELNETLTRTFFLPSELAEWLYLVAAGIGTAYLFLIRWSRPPENAIFDVYFVVAACTAICAIVFLQARFMAATRSFRRCLERLAQHPVINAFGRVPQLFAAKAGAAFFSVRPHPGDLEESVRLLSQLSDKLQSQSGLSPEQSQAIREQSEHAREILREFMTQGSNAQLREFELGGGLSGILTSSGSLFASMLTDYWARCPVQSETKSDSSHGTPQSDEAHSGWAADAELFIALQLTTLIRQVFAQLRNLLTFLVLLVLLLLWALNSYPFQPHRLIVIFSYGLVLWCMATALLAVLNFNRDEVLSHLTGTTPNKLTFDRTLVVPVLTYVVIPLFSLAAVQFPEVSDSAFSWIGFIQRALHG